MITLTVSRYGQQIKSEYATFGEAAEQAIGELDNDASWPVSILDGDKVLWKQDGPFGQAVEKLRQFVYEDKEEL